MFEVRFATPTYAPPRTVTIMTPANDWNAIHGQYLDDHWLFSLDETQIWTEPSYFKFQLDGSVWMDGAYRAITPTAGSTYNFDESEVTFSMTETTVAPSEPGPAIPTNTPAQPAQRG